ncbi:hypothetical protein [Prescottella subtropica]|uniref:hypothetical protein n=1 Tax=Prescottella subtropica TaxID=2545757 RepID=UPI0010F44605|nr:hypothetical protein [Prescottella subtropica]
MVRRLLSIVAVTGFAGVLPLVAPAEASACSCVYMPDDPRILEQVSHASSVFTGTVVSERVADQTAFFEFEVREVFDGDVGGTTTVSSSIQGPACGRGFEVGTEYLVFGSDHETNGADFSDNSCSATTKSTNQRTRDAATTVYGAPRTITVETGTAVETNAVRVWGGVAAGVLAIGLIAFGFDRWRSSRS